MTRIAGLTVYNAHAWLSMMIWAIKLEITPSFVALMSYRQNQYRFYLLYRLSGSQLRQR